MALPDELLVDRADVYDVATQDNNGVTSGGTTIIAANKAMLLQPLRDEEVMTLGGDFDRTLIRALLNSPGSMAVDAKIILQKNTIAGTGTVCYVQSLQKYAEPWALDTLDHAEAILKVRQ